MLQKPEDEMQTCQKDLYHPHFKDIKILAGDQVLMAKAPEKIGQFPMVQGHFLLDSNKDGIHGEKEMRISIAYL